MSLLNLFLHCIMIDYIIVLIFKRIREYKSVLPMCFMSLCTICIARDIVKMNHIRGLFRRHAKQYMC